MRRDKTKGIRVTRSPDLPEKLGGTKKVLAAGCLNPKQQEKAPAPDFSIRWGNREKILSGDVLGKNPVQVEVRKIGAVEGVKRPLRIPLMPEGDTRYVVRAALKGGRLPPLVSRVRTGGPVFGTVEKEWNGMGCLFPILGEPFEKVSAELVLDTHMKIRYPGNFTRVKILLDSGSRVQIPF